MLQFARWPHDRRKTATGCPQDRPETLQDELKTPKRRPKTAPRPPRSAPRPRQDRPKTAPRQLQDRPKNAQRPPKNAQECPGSSSNAQARPRNAAPAQERRAQHLIGFAQHTEPCPRSVFQIVHQDGLGDGAKSQEDLILVFVDRSILSPAPVWFPLVSCDFQTVCSTAPPVLNDR